MATYITMGLAVLEAMYVPEQMLQPGPLGPYELALATVHLNRKDVVNFDVETLSGRMLKK